MGWLVVGGIILYFICGYSFLLFGQIFASKHEDSLLMLACLCDVCTEDNFLVGVIVVLWPMFLFGAILMDFIPWLIKKIYVGYVAIIFLIIALFKKEEENDQDN